MEMTSYTYSIFIVSVKRLLHLVLQKSGEHKRNAFHLPCYRVFKRYLILLGQYPGQTDRSRNVRVAVLTFSLFTFFVLAISQLFISIREQNMDALMECIPSLVTLFVTCIKLLNHNINRQKFKNLFERMSEQWKISEINGEVHVLKKITEQGSKMGNLYRGTIWLVLILFLCIPLSAPILDFVKPLNKTRTKIPLFQLNYVINTEKYFYTMYLHSAWCSFVTALIIITMDSLYIVIIHYACGLFALCGYQIKKATEIDELSTHRIAITDINYDQFRRCLTTHYEAIKFYEYMNESTRISYLFQVGLNMIGITTTAVQVVMYFDRPEEAFRIIMFLFGQQFHLYALSLPGQVLLDQSSELTNDIYASKWHQIPLKFAKVLHIMQIRSSRPCKLTAGGLYEMSIENFGIIFKTCMSYFTILLSLRE